MVVRLRNRTVYIPSDSRGRRMHPGSAHTWFMAVSVSLSTRVSPELRQRLVSEARRRGLPLATLARDLLGAALDGEAFRAPHDGALVNEVECVFHDLPPDAGVRREVCIALARTAEAGGAAGVTAGKELVGMIDYVQRLYAPEGDELEL